MSAADEKLNWQLGTIGFGYAPWSGAFYPRHIKPADHLSFYAQHFSTVELDTTFHAIPPPERVRHWHGATPADFRFCVKAPRTITHELPLHDAVKPMREFLAVMAELGPKLAVVLLQFPPAFNARQSPKLAWFLSYLVPYAGEVRFAIELRAPSWYEGAALDRTRSLLAEHRCAWVSADENHEPAAVFATTDFLYLRWIGEHNRFPQMNIEELDMTDRLTWWCQQAESAARAAPVRQAWGFFNNHYAGYAVATCNRFKRMLGLPVSETAKPLVQGHLFE